MQTGTLHDNFGNSYQLAGYGHGELGFSLNPIKAVKKIGKGAFKVTKTVVKPIAKVTAKGGTFLAKTAYKGVKAVVKVRCAIVQSPVVQAGISYAATSPQGAAASGGVNAVTAATCGAPKAPAPIGPGAFLPPPDYAPGYGPRPLPFFRFDNPVLWLGAAGAAAYGAYALAKK